MNEPTGYRRLDPASPLAEVRFDAPADWILVVRVRGELDIVSVPLLRTALHARLTRPCRVVLDLAGVTLLTSAALTLLLELHHDTRESDRHLVLTGAGHRAVHRPLRMAGLLGLFDTRRGIEHALSGSRALRRPARSPAPPTTTDHHESRSTR